MTTNFFQQVSALQLTGDVQIIIKQGTENKLTVSVLLQNEQCGDNAKQVIPPLILRGTTEELDSGFFENITKPLQSASGLMVNMDAFLKQLEEAKKQSAMEKEKADKGKKAKEESDKKFKEAMSKADELERAGKYREAWIKVPDPAQFPDHAETIRKRKAALAAQFAPDLFEEAPLKASSNPSEGGEQESLEEDDIKNSDDDTVNWQDNEDTE